MSDEIRFVVKKSKRIVSSKLIMKLLCLALQKKNLLQVLLQTSLSSSYYNIFLYKRITQNLIILYLR